MNFNNFEIEFFGEFPYTLALSVREAQSSLKH